VSRVIVRHPPETQPQTCVACAHIGYDVGPRLVRVDTIDTGEVQRRVRVAFEVQVRCVDAYACAERQKREPMT